MTLDDLGKALAAGAAPALVVLDANLTDSHGALKTVRNLAGQVTVVLAAFRAVRTPEVPGAVVIWRPVSVGTIAARVIEILGHPSQPQAHACAKIRSMSEPSAASKPSPPVSKPHEAPPRGSARAIHRVCTQCNNMFRVTPENFEAKQCPNCHKG